MTAMLFLLHPGLIPAAFRGFRATKGCRQVNRFHLAKRKCVRDSNGSDGSNVLFSIGQCQLFTMHFFVKISYMVTELPSWDLDGICVFVSKVTFRGHCEDAIVANFKLIAGV